MSRDSVQAVCVFCGSSPGVDPACSAAAREIAQSIVARGWRLVFGGGRSGLMGEVADAALAAGGDVVGVIPRNLDGREHAHRDVTRLHVVDGMHERKTLMHELSDAFVVLPGGFGTLDELFGALTWAQLGVDDKPIGLLDVGAYYRGLLEFLDHAVVNGFITAPNRGRLITAETVSVLLDGLVHYADAAA